MMAMATVQEYGRLALGCLLAVLVIAAAGVLVWSAWFGAGEVEADDFDKERSA